MPENKYDDPAFFEQYSAMLRSTHGLAGAGEWHAFRALFPPVVNRKALDLGCGFGWHCRYLAERGASKVIGVDLSEKMLQVAREKNCLPGIEYRRSAIEDLDFPDGEFDLVVSSLALHYVESFQSICSMVRRWLVPGGHFVLSVEHPIFTAQGKQDWIYGEDGRRLYWPVDSYFMEGRRQAVFLGESVEKYHKTLTTYVGGLLESGLSIQNLVEPTPDPSLMTKFPELADEMRRPMMLLLAARKL